MTRRRARPRLLLVCWCVCIRSSCGQAGWGTGWGDACLPTDVRSLLRSETTSSVSSACQNLIKKGGAKVCSAECRDALVHFQKETCYPYLSQPQRLQPRLESPLHPQGKTAHTVAALAGRWYGIYPASGIELIEATFESSSTVLTGTKLTGNDFVRAGRASWTISPTSCKVVSSLWSGVFTPRWDGCKLRVVDRDHMQIILPHDGGDDEILNFVRANLIELLAWNEPLSPAHGFFQAMLHCGVSPEDTSSSLIDDLLAVFHHSHGTVVIDQVLLVLPLLLLGGWQMQGELMRTQWLVPTLGTYAVLLCLRLNYLGVG